MKANDIHLIIKILSGYSRHKARHIAGNGRKEAGKGRNTARMARELSATVCGLMFLILSVACSGGNIEGRWVEPVPGMEHQTQGFRLEAGGWASSINMATLHYEHWEKEGNRLILSGKSIGNHQTLPFTDTLTIEKLTRKELILKSGGILRNYRKP